MKEIKAVIRPNKLAALRSALLAVPGFPGMTVLKGDGVSAPARTPYRGTIADELTDYTPKVHVVIVCPDEVVEPLLACIEKVATMGQLGDGIIWVTPVERASFLFKNTAGPTT